MTDEVPVEVLEYIFSYLPLKSMFSVSVVNTAWRACCDTQLLYNIGRMILRVPHLRTLLDTNIDIDLQELLIATEKSYLILGGEDDDEHLKEIISKTGLTVDTWNPIWSQSPHYAKVSCMLSKYPTSRRLGGHFVGKHNR
jgi:hypothetical protein